VAFRDKVPGIYSLNGFGKIQEQQIVQSMFREYMKRAKDHRQHLFLVSRETLKHVWGEDYMNIKLLKHVAVFDQFNNANQLTNHPGELYELAYAKVVKLHLPLKNLNLADLLGYSWVILNIKDGLTPETSSQIQGIVQFCNSASIPVWITDADIRRVIVQDEVYGQRSKEELHFDLPKIAGNQLIDVSATIASEAREYGESIVAARIKSWAIELELGYHLYQMDTAARTHSKSQYWLQNFGVKNRSDYCTKKLSLSSDLGSQYISAVRNIELLRPGLLKRLFSSGGDSPELLPHGYTRYRDLNGHIPSLLMLQDHAEFEALEDMIFDPNLSSRQLFKELPGKIEAITGVKLPKPEDLVKPIIEPSLVTNVSTVTFDLFSCIEQFRNDLRTNLPGELFAQVCLFLDEISGLFESSKNFGTESILSEEELQEMIADAKATLNPVVHE